MTLLACASQSNAKTDAHYEGLMFEVHNRDKRQIGKSRVLAR